MLIVTCFYRPQRSCEGYVFTSLCLSTGGYLIRYTPRKKTPPGTRYTPRDRYTPPWTRYNPPGLGTPPWSRHHPTPPPGLGTPPKIRPLLRTVRILLECILVKNKFGEYPEECCSAVLVGEIDSLFALFSLEYSANY